MDHVALPTTNRVMRPDFPVRNFMYPYMQHGVGKVGIWNLRLGFNPGHRMLGHVQLCHGLKSGSRICTLVRGTEPRYPRCIRARSLRTCAS